MKNILLLFFHFFIFCPVSAQHVCTASRVSHKSSNKPLSGVFQSKSLWDNGKTIKVKFLNGNTFLKKKVKQYANVWCTYGNIRFTYVESGYSDIRVQFDNSGQSYSYAGTGALQIDQSEHTMNFGWLNENTSDTEFSRVVTHEFGHALGLLHEHQNPLARIRWNKAKVYAYYTQQLGWTRASVDRNIFETYSVDHTNQEYDDLSIMHYAIPAEFTSDKKGIEWNTKLSEKDKALIAKIYPFSTEKEKEKERKPTRKKIDITNVHHYSLTEQQMIKVKVDISINSYLNQNCRAVVYLYDATTNQYLSWGDFGYFVPIYTQGNTWYQVVAHIPFGWVYSGTYKLKFFIDVLDGYSNVVHKTGWQFMDFETD